MTLTLFELNYDIDIDFKLLTTFEIVCYRNTSNSVKSNLTSVYGAFVGRTFLRFSGPYEGLRF